jgi:acetoin utilization deacetylase AcuC-like enzyme
MEMNDLKVDRSSPGHTVAREDVLDVFWHPDCLKHNTGEGVFEAPRSDLMLHQEPHPENERRILNIRSILERGPLAGRIRWHAGRHATREEIAAFHLERYIDSILEADRSGPMRPDGAGTVVGPGSWVAACAAAGTGIAATDHVLRGHGHFAYALIRPPGHHAQPDKADGSCIFNNIGIAARHALASGIQKIAVIDWDQHHGNGTQEGFYSDNRVLTISIHMPHGRWGSNHRQLGTVEEVGIGAGAGFNLNIPVPFGAGDQCYADVMNEVAGPVIDQFAPSLLLVACGQDANQFDPNGRSLLTMHGFRNLGRIARAWALKYSGTRLVLFQEGGYALTYTAYCAYATVEGLLEAHEHLADPSAYYDQAFAQPAPDSHDLLTRWEEYVASARQISEPR